MADWIAIVIAMAALGVSAWTHFDTRPKLKVTQSLPMVLYPQDHEVWPGAHRAMISVELVNEGSQPVRISRVDLGGNHQGLMIPSDSEGPGFPYTLEPRGGRVGWQFDYWRIKSTVEANYHGGQITLQAEVLIGRKKIRARPIIKVLELAENRDSVRPPITGARKMRNKLIAPWWRSLAWLRLGMKRPVLISPYPWVKFEDIDLNRGLIQRKFKVYGHWPVPAHQLVTVAGVPTEGGWPRMERLWDLQPVRVPFTWPWQVRTIWLPMIPRNHGKCPGTEFWWHAEPRVWHQVQYGAHTLAEVEAAMPTTEQPET